jgi:hypothetical protein
LGRELDHVLVNGLLPGRFTAKEARELDALNGAGSPVARETLTAALSADTRARAQRSQLARLRRRIGAGVSTLPFLLTPELGLEDLEALSREIERKL